MFVIYEDYTTELCTLVKRSNTLLKIKRLWDTCLGNISVYIWAEGLTRSTFPVAAANVVLVCLHTCCSLVLLQRAPVSQRSKQTAEHSHFTLLNLSHMAFTPVAALLRNPDQTNALLPATTNLQLHLFNGSVKGQNLAIAVLCQIKLPQKYKSLLLESNYDSKIKYKLNLWHGKTSVWL